MSSAGINLAFRLLIIVAFGLLSASPAVRREYPREFWSVHQSPRAATTFKPPEPAHDQELPCGFVIARSLAAHALMNASRVMKSIWTATIPKSRWWFQFRSCQRQHSHGIRVIATTQHVLELTAISFASPLMGATGV
jgi:hypothetical protein